jgi:hypothetical protein
MRFASRNDALIFAQRTRKNLEAIEKAFAEDKEVHVVTQLAISLLGLLVFPWERHFAKHVEQLSLNALVREGWPQWEISLGTSETLGNLVYHLRNATSHCHLYFSSDSRLMDEVDIEVEDYKPHAEAPYWRARICATELRRFCLKFISLLENTLG